VVSTSIRACMSWIHHTRFRPDRFWCGQRAQLTPEINRSTRRLNLQSRAVLRLNSNPLCFLHRRGGFSLLRCGGSSWPTAKQVVADSYFKTKRISGHPMMRRPLVAELSAEEQSLARRWLLTSGSLYSIIVVLIIGILMMTSGADNATVTATSERKQISLDRSPMRPYGSLPDPIQSIPACAASRSCAALRAEAVGRPR
jgi:hypothetical protein